MSAAAGGLGRGLAAILTGPSLSVPEASLRAKFVESALSSLANGQALGLAGYVHTDDGDADVTLRSPELRSLHPTQAYQLFTALERISSRPDGHHHFSIGDLEAHAVALSRGDARGICFFGDASLPSDQVVRLEDFCAVYLPVILEHDRPADDTERLHLVLDHDGGTVHAEVSIDGRTGFGSAPRTDMAAAQAALTAVSEHAKLTKVGAVRSGDRSAALVVAAGEMGRVAMGAAPVAGGPDAAAALAAFRAGKGLER